jgi:hypothetical protein
MLRIGQKRSIEQTALAAEPGCAADSNSAELGSKYRPDKRALCTSFRLTQPPRTGWPLLRTTSVRLTLIWISFVEELFGGDETVGTITLRQSPAL